VREFCVEQKTENNIPSHFLLHGHVDRFAMFTGLIEHKGIISSLVIDDGGCLLAIAYANPILDDCHIGDSIAVDGVCLTVTHFDLFKENGWFQVWLSNETLHRTTFGAPHVLSPCSTTPDGTQARAVLAQA